MHIVGLHLCLLQTKLWQLLHLALYLLSLPTQIKHLDRFKFQKMENAKSTKKYKKMKNITKLKNTTHEKHWKQCSEIHFWPFATTASSELTRTCVRHRFDFLLETQYDSIFYRQIVAVQANFARLMHKVGLQTGHRRPSHRYNFRFVEKKKSRTRQSSFVTARHEARTYERTKKGRQENIGSPKWRY